MTTSQALASTSILQALWWSALDKMNMAQADRDTAKAQVAAVAAVQDAFDASTSAIHQNGDLSAQGRASALVEAGKRGLDQLATLTTPTLASLDEQIVGLSRALRRAATGPDATMLTAVLAVETRAGFSQIDPLFRPGKYLELCSSGEDDAACLAVENSSSFAPLLSPEVIEQGRTVRGARVLPDQAAGLDVAQDLRALLASAVATARRHMSVGPLSDPLQVANLGAYPITDASTAEEA